MASFKRKVKVEVPAVLDNDLALLYLIDKDISEPNLALLVLLDSIDSSTEEDRMRQHIANSLDIDADGSVPAHDVAIDVVVEGLRRLRLKDDLDLGLPLSWNHSVHGFD